MNQKRLKMAKKRIKSIYSLRDGHFGYKLPKS